MLKKQGKVLIIHGGGLIDCSKQVLLRLAQAVMGIYDRVFLGFYSFEALYTKSFWIEYNLSLSYYLSCKRGTYFGTCRDIFMEGERLEKAINLLKDEAISTIIVCGGDGSARQVDEMYKAFEAEGINIIFPIPLTIDGINGGYSLGINQAVKESVRQIENMAATAFETRDNEMFGVLCAEIQGRNRDDITAQVLQKFVIQGKVADRTLEELTLIVVPKNIDTDSEKLYECINSSEKRTLVILTENGKIKISDIKENTSRKVRSVVIGHQSQSNNLTTQDDEYEIEAWVENVVPFIKRDPYGSFCISKRNGSSYSGLIYDRKPINYYAKLNPYQGQIATLPKDLETLVKFFMAGK